MDPVFAATKRRLGEMKIEWDRLKDARVLLSAVQTAPDRTATQTWISNAALSAGVSGLYTGMEEALRSVLSVVDGHVPSGDRSHQDILDQASVAIPNGRPPLISEQVYTELTLLRGFRHFERHNYRFRFETEQVTHNEERAESLVPLFIADIERFIEAMSPNQPPP